MCGRVGIVAAALTIALCGAQPSSTMSADARSRDEFLKMVDAALAARDAQAILALADVDAWRQAGYRGPDLAAMTLPDAPIARVRMLSESEVLYKDGHGREWKLRLRDRGAGDWAIVLRDRACPRGGIERSPEFERGGRQSDAPPTWTPLECWPLPV